MNVHLTRRQLLQSGLALGSALALPQARACEFTSTTLRITHPWTRVTSEDARYAIVNMKIDQVLQADRLIGVETPVAGAAEIVGDPAGSKGLNLLIQQGQELQIGEAGIELRLLKLKQPLLMARTYPMTLIFEKGGVLQAELNVDYAAN
jgi:copper(I)-binding protein